MQDSIYRQVLTAAASGCMAPMEIIKYKYSSVSDVDAI